jgi:hypothetical protein
MTRIAVGGTSPSGLRWPNYVNGRLLTAQDLSAEQDAVLVRDRWLGLAIGSGVAVGLEVTGTPGASVLHVSPGTGVSSGGTAVHLDAPATLDLTAVSSAAPADGALFSECAPPSTTTKAPTAGAYLLVVRPASSYEGKVPVAGSPTATLPTPCTSRWQVEDVVFAAIRLEGFTADTTPENRRNHLAHFCFGSDRLDDLARSGFTEPVPWRGIEGLADLTACDLPLAVFDWDGAALTFVDRWSARRRPVRPSAAVELAPVVGDDRTAEGEARFLQFQDQLAGLLATPAGSSVRAADVFPRLPPVGLVPFDPLAVAKRLLAGQPDFTPAVGHQVPATPKGLPDRVILKRLLGLDFGRELGSLGAVSTQLLELQQQIDVLRSEVDDLTAAKGGKGDTASDRERGRKLAAAVIGALVDTAGAGVDLGVFFAGLQVRLGVVDRETVDFTVRRSWYDEPIELGRRPLLNVLFVLTDDGGAVAPYVLFTKRHRGVRWIDFGPRLLDG